MFDARLWCTYLILGGAPYSVPGTFVLVLRLPVYGTCTSAVLDLYSTTVLVAVLEYSTLCRYVKRKQLVMGPASSPGTPVQKFEMMK